MAKQGPVNRYHEIFARRWVDVSALSSTCKNTTVLDLGVDNLPTVSAARGQDDCA